MKSYLMVVLAMGGSAIAAPPTDQPQQSQDDESNVQHDGSPADKPIGQDTRDEKTSTQARKETDKKLPSKMDQTTADTEVFFKFDSAKLSDNGRTALLNLAEQAKDAMGTQIILDGHADSTGPSPYNVGLSARRAEAVRNFLTENGYSANRIVMAMYGEDGPRRSKRALDRRVSVTITAEPLYSIIDSSKFATAVMWQEPVTLAEIEGPDQDRVARTARR